MEADVLYFLDTVASRPNPAKRTWERHSKGNHAIDKAKKMRICLDPSKCGKHVYQYCDKTVRELYVEFLELHPMYKLTASGKPAISPSAFHNIKKQKLPWIVKTPDSHCLCEKHEQASSFLQAWYNEARKVHGKSCKCVCNFCKSGKCSEEHHPSKGIFDFMKLCLCDPIIFDENDGDGDTNNRSSNCPPRVFK